MLLPFGVNRLTRIKGPVIKISDKLDTPLIMKGINIGFMYQVTTKYELGTCEHVVIEIP